MLNWFVGPVDVPAAAVLIAIAIGGAVILTTMIASWRTKEEEVHKFELAQMARSAETSIRMAALNAERERDMGRIMANKEIEFRKIDTGLIDMKASDAANSG